MAVTLTAAQLQAALGITDEVATRLLKVATILVERFAPGAPSQIQDESTIRTAGYLNEMPNAASPFRNGRRSDYRIRCNSRFGSEAFWSYGAAVTLEESRRAGAI